MECVLTLAGVLTISILMMAFVYWMAKKLS